MRYDQNSMLSLCHNVQPDNVYQSRVCIFNIPDMNTMNKYNLYMCMYHFLLLTSYLVHYVTHTCTKYKRFFSISRLDLKIG